MTGSARAFPRVRSSDFQADRQSLLKGWEEMSSGRPNEPVRTIVLDTNVLLRHKRPSNALALIGREVGRGKLRLVVPEVVIREAANHHREAVERAAIKTSQSIKQLRELAAAGDLTEPALDLDEVEEAVATRLRETLVGLGAELAAIPEPSHHDLVQRSLRRRRPFTKDDTGYRDALIWESVREAASDASPVTFVTQDRRAFHAPSGSGVLPPDLAADLSEVGRSAVEVLEDLPEVVDAYIDPEALLLAETEERFKSDAVREQLLAALERSLPGEVIDRDNIREIETDDLDLAAGLHPDEEIESAEIEHAVVDRPTGLHYLAVLDARTLQGDRAAIEFEAEVDAVVGCEVSATTQRTEFSPLTGDMEISHGQFWTNRDLDQTLLVGGEAVLDRSTGEIAELAVPLIRL